MQNLEWYLADLKSTGQNTIETVEKSLTDMFIRLAGIYPCLIGLVHVCKLYIKSLPQYQDQTIHAIYMTHLLDNQKGNLVR